MRLPVCCCLLLLVAGIRGQDDEFDLSDALDPKDVKPTTKPKPDEGILKEPTAQPKPDVHDATPKKPTAKPQPGGPVDGGFSLDEALGGDDHPKQPTEKPRPPQPAQPGGGGGFSLDDALGGDDQPKQPTEKPRPPQPAQPGGGGVIHDGDLGEADEHRDDNPGGHDNKPSDDGQGQGGENQSMVAGIVSTIAVAAVGAVSSFIAYQKKKLCFKGSAEDPENVNMESHKGDQSEPQVQSTLLAK